jgi:hypothetical protein
MQQKKIKKCVYETLEKIARKVVPFFLKILFMLVIMILICSEELRGEHSEEFLYLMCSQKRG